MPLELEYSTTQLQKKVAELNEQGRSPVYLVHFTQNACADTARDLLSTNFCTKEEKHAIARAQLKVVFDLPQRSHFCLPLDFHNPRYCRS